jgi:hypothetical protein
MKSRRRMVPPIEEIPLQSAGYRIGGTQSGHAESRFEADDAVLGGENIGDAVFIDPDLPDEVPDQCQTMERIAYKHNAAQSEDCPTYRGNQQGVPRHLDDQTGLHDISPGLRGLRPQVAASGLVFNAHIMPGPRNLACDARHSKRNPRRGELGLGARIPPGAYLGAFLTPMSAL